MFYKKLFPKNRDDAHLKNHHLPSNPRVVRQAQPIALPSISLPPFLTKYIVSN